MGNREPSTAVETRSSLIYFAIGVVPISASICIELLGLGEPIVGPAPEGPLFLAPIVGFVAFFVSPCCFWKGYQLSQRSVAGYVKLSEWLNVLGMAAWTCWVIIDGLFEVLLFL